MWSQRFSVRFVPAVFLTTASFFTGLPDAIAATMSWKAPSSGQFNTSSNWNSGTPGPNDLAVFGVTGSYTVTFTSSPSNQSVTLSAGAATLASSGGPWTYNLTSTTSADVSVSGGALVLGSAAGRLNVSASAGLSVSSGGALDLTNASAFTTSSGTTTIYAGGLLSVGSGCSFNANGSGLWVNGGTLQTPGGTVSMSTPGGAITVSNSGQMSFPAGSYWGYGNILVQSGGTLNYGNTLWAAGQSISVDGPGSTLQSAAADVHLASGGTLNVTNGGYVSCGALVATAPSGNATAIVDGYGFRGSWVSSWLVANSLQLGTGGNGGSLTVRNDANAAVSGATFLGADAYANSGGTMLLNPNGSVQFDGEVHVGDAGLAGQVGFITVGGATGASILTLTGTSNFTLGAASASSGSLVINSGGLFSTGTGAIAVNKTGQIIINSDGEMYLNGNLTVNGGTVQVPGGVFGNGYAANVTISNGGMMSFSGGSSLYWNSGNLLLQSGGELDTGSGTTTINGTGHIVLSGGVLRDQGSIAIDGGVLLAQSGQLVGTGSNAISVTGGGTLAVASGVGWYAPDWQVNIDGGNVSFGQSVLNGTISLTRGSLAYGGNLAVGANGSSTNDIFTFDYSGLMQTGGDFSLGALQCLAIGGTTTVRPYMALVLSGGTLSTGVLALSPGAGFYFNSGSLAITGSGGLTFGPGGPLGSSLKLVAGQSLSVTNTATIAAGALVDLENGGSFSAAMLANSGELFLNGPLAAAGSGTINNAGLVHGQGRIAAQVNNQPAGEVRIEAGGRLVLQGANGPNQGLISLQGGILELSQSLSNAPGGRITGRGTFIDNAGLTNQGSVQFSAGLTDVYGAVTNAAGASIITSGGGTTTFWNNVSNAGLVRTSSGCTSVFFGTTTASGTGTFTGPGLMDLEGPHSGFSPVVVEVPSGSPLMASAVYLGSYGTFDTTSGTLTVSGAISGPYALTKSGPGTLVLSGSNIYSGGTYVLGGNLIVTNAYGLEDGSNLTVGDAGAFLSPIIGGSAIVGDLSSSVPVPEPQTLVLLAACVLLLLSRRQRSTTA